MQLILDLLPKLIEVSWREGLDGQCFIMKTPVYRYIKEYFSALAEETPACRVH